MNDMTKLSSVLSLIERIPGLPVSTVTGPSISGKELTSGPGDWLFSAASDSENQWFIEIGVSRNGSVNKVAFLKVNGGVEEAAMALDMLSDHFKVAA